MFNLAKCIYDIILINLLPIKIMMPTNIKIGFPFFFPTDILLLIKSEDPKQVYKHLHKTQLGRLNWALSPTTNPRRPTFPRVQKNRENAHVLKIHSSLRHTSPCRHTTTTARSRRRRKRNRLLLRRNPPESKPPRPSSKLGFYSLDPN